MCRLTRCIPAAAALTCLLTCVDPAAGAAASATSRDPQAREVRVAYVVARLKQRATGLWLKRKSFDAARPDVEAYRRVVLDRDDLRRAVCRPQSGNPAIDARVRLQLVALEPDFAGVGDQELQRLLAGLPALRDPDGRAAPRDGGGAPGGRVGPARLRGPGAAAVVGGGFDPTLSVVQSGAVLDVTGTVSADRRYVTLTTRASTADVLRIRQVAFQAVRVPRRVAAASNEQVIAFRDAVIRRLPQARGVALRAMIRDVDDRRAARHPSTAQRFSEMARMTDDAGGKLQFDQQTRAGLRVAIRELATRAGGNPAAREVGDDVARANGRYAVRADGRYAARANGPGTQATTRATQEGAPRSAAEIALDDADVRLALENLRPRVGSRTSPARNGP